VSTIDDRLAALERKVAVMELERAYEQIQVKATTPSEDAFKEMNHYLTMLLGITSAQQIDIKAVKNDVTIVKQHVEHIDQRFDEVDRQFNSINQRFVGLDLRLYGMDKHFTSLEGKFDQMLIMLSTLTSKPQREI
jgi:hypothetical protein